MRKKSQMQIGETVAILAVFFIIIMIAFVVFFNITKGQLEEDRDINIEDRSVGIVKIILTMPELQCSSTAVIENACLDRVKLDVVSSSKPDPLNPGAITTGGNIFTSNVQEYFSFLGNTKIQVYQIFTRIPDNTDPLTPWILYDNSLEDFSTSIQTNIPINIYDPITKKTNFGYIEITTFSS
tara:strand:+ start:264 stop:809 length:546 start_codon:yes stop_codon:yes gene_type:complete